MMHARLTVIQQNRYGRVPKRVPAEADRRADTQR